MWFWEALGNFLGWLVGVLAAAGLALVMSAVIYVLGKHVTEFLMGL